MIDRECNHELLDMNASSPRPADGSPEVVIRVRNLMKTYGRRTAIDGMDLDVHRGEIFAFLGPNGAGKTTTVEILVGFRSRTGGDVSVLGVDPAEADSTWRERIGVVLQESSPEPGLTVRECLQLYAGYYRAPRDVDDTLSLIGLDEVATCSAAELSGGQLRRLDVALALIGDPELLFLDEPTTGFDPSARRTAWDVIELLRELGKTIFLTTHYMDEAEQLADRIAVLAAGRVTAQGPPRTLGGRHQMPASIRFTLPEKVVAADLPACIAALVRSEPSGATELVSADAATHLLILTDWARRRSIDLSDLEVRRPSLEDVYLMLTTGAPAARR